MGPREVCLGVEESCSDVWRELVGENLSGVTFVRDYLRLEFNPPPVISAHSRVAVAVGGRSAVLGEEPFANLLLGLIGNVVRAVRFDEGRAFRLEFESGGEIVISWRDEDYKGPEAMELKGRDGRIVVV